MTINFKQQLFCASHKRANVFHNACHLLLCWLTDGCYDVEIFESLLKKNFKSHRLLFGSPQPNFGVEAAVITTTISNAFLFIFSNCNGVDSRNLDNDKLMLRKL